MPCSVHPAGGKMAERRGSLRVTHFPGAAALARVWQVAARIITAKLRCNCRLH